MKIEFGTKRVNRIIEDLITRMIVEEGNPPPWVENRKLWEGAINVISPYWYKFDNPWAIVANVYLEMGGEIKR